VLAKEVVLCFLQVSVDGTYNNLESFFQDMTTTGLLDSLDFSRAGNIEIVEFQFHVTRNSPIGLAQDFSLLKFLQKASKPSKKV
jgi:hypothetical protein